MVASVLHFIKILILMIFVLQFHRMMKRITVYNW